MAAAPPDLDAAGPEFFSRFCHGHSRVVQTQEPPGTWTHARPLKVFVFEIEMAVSRRETAEFFFVLSVLSPYFSIELLLVEALTAMATDLPTRVEQKSELFFSPL